MKVLVLGAGGPAGANTVRALRHAGHYVVATEGNELHLGWSGVQTFHLPEHTVEEVNRIIERHGIEVVLAQPDSLVAWLSECRGEVAASTFLPPAETITRCQDKLATSLHWYRKGLRDFPPYKLVEPWPDELHQARDLLGLPLWLRATRGAGAKGAIKVDSLDSAYHWLRFWATRGADIEWVAEEYLPGRDLAWSSLWYEGELVTSFTRERLEYLYPHLTPEGLTGTPTVAQVVWDDRVNAVAYQAVRCLDSKPHGIYSVDLREDKDGYPRPTEINAGRGFTTFGLWSMYGVNFLDVAVRLAVDGRKWWLTRPDLSEPPQYDALPHGLKLSRHIDIDFHFSAVKRKPLTLCA